MHSTPIPQFASQASPTPTNNAAPTWDAHRRELRYGGQLIKRYRVHAPNQQLVLAAFQEDGWPSCIDDPLPPHGERLPKERLQATIKSLNRSQVTPLIRFHGNGSACQIYWEIVAPEAPDPPPSAEPLNHGQIAGTKPGPEEP